MHGRRNVLSLLGTTGVVASAGCLDTVSRVHNSLTGSESAIGPPYERWLPAPTNIEHADEFSAMYVDLETVRDLGESLPESAVSQFERFEPETQWLKRLGTSIENVESTLSVSPAMFVTTGTFDASTVGDELESMDSEASYEYHDFDVFRGISRDGSVNQSVAVDSTTILQTVPDSALEQWGPTIEEDGDAENTTDDGTETDDSPAIDRLIETGTGDRDRRQDVDDTVATLLDSTETPTYLQLFSYPESGEWYPDNSVAMAIGISVRDERSTTRLRFVYEDESSAHEDSIREFVPEEDFSDSASEITYEVDGRLASVEVSMPTADFDVFEEDDREERAGPQAGVQFSQSDESVTVTLTTIDRADEITIQHNHEAVETLEDPGAGDSVTVDASSGDTITVVGSYEGNEAVLAEYDA